MMIQKSRLFLAYIEDFLMVEDDRLLVTWKTLEKLLLSMWANFRGELKILAAQKALKQYFIFCIK